MDRLADSIRTVLEKLLLFWLVALCLLAFFWPAVCAKLLPGVEFDPFVATKGWLSGMIAVTMLAIGSLLPAEEIAQVFRRWPLVLAGTVVQYVSMPVLAYGVGRLFGLEGPWMIGIVMVVRARGNGLQRAHAHRPGNVSYSVSLTTSATVLSPLVVPGVLWLSLGRMVDNFPAGQVFFELCWMVVLPVITGHLLSRKWPLWAAIARGVGAIIANLTILWIIAVVVGVNRGGVSQLPAVLISALLTVNLGGYAAGYLAGGLLRLPVPMRRALTLEIGMQNAGLGTTLAMGLFADKAAALPAALYTFGCMLTARSSPGSGPADRTARPAGGESGSGRAKTLTAEIAVSDDPLRGTFPMTFRKAGRGRRKRAVSPPRRSTLAWGPAGSGRRA